MSVIPACSDHAARPMPPFGSSSARRWSLNARLARLPQKQLSSAGAVADTRVKERPPLYEKDHTSRESDPPKKTTHLNIKQSAQRVCANSFCLSSACFKGKKGGTVCTNCPRNCLRKTVLLFGWGVFFWVGLPFMNTCRKVGVLLLGEVFFSRERKLAFLSLEP